MNEALSSRLPFLLPWIKVNLLIRSIAQRTWPEAEWRIIKPHLRRALEVRRDVSREAWWN